MPPKANTASFSLARFRSRLYSSSLSTSPFARTPRTSLVAITNAPLRQPTHAATYNLRNLSGTPTLTMASDEDYMAFLNKANQDTGSVSAQSSSKATLKAKDHGVEVPKEITAACQDAVYVSDADEPFEEVSLKWDKGLPTESQFASLTNHPSPSDAEITIMDPYEWDPKGAYGDLLKAVRQATAGNDIRVYRVVRDHIRVEYWILSATEGKIVGAKALAVEG